MQIQSRAGRNSKQGRGFALFASPALLWLLNEVSFLRIQRSEISAFFAFRKQGAFAKRKYPKRLTNKIYPWILRYTEFSVLTARLLAAFAGVCSACSCERSGAKTISLTYPQCYASIFPAQPTPNGCEAKISSRYFALPNLPEFQGLRLDFSSFWFEWKNFLKFKQKFSKVIL